MSFNYGYTCPNIDKEIEAAKQNIRDNIEEIVEECCPLLTDDPLAQFASRWADEIYNGIESCFEIVRETNENMRTEAERQIGNLEDEIAELKGELEATN